ncbi:MAG: hypothetical protein K2O00_01110 [Muribaculaceae bacterium]|nr:hypothetical protein [Muribaculaceae bacterium]
MGLPLTEDGSTVIIREHNPQNHNSRSRKTESAEFFQVGRTYWYEFKSPTYRIDTEFGISIAAKETIDGTEWNRIDLVKRAQRNYDNMDNYINTDFCEDPVTVAYLREEKGNIYRTLKNTDYYNKTLSTPWNNILYNCLPENFDSPETPVYGCGELGFRTNVARLWAEENICDAVITGVESIENSGRHYNKYTLTGDHHDDVYKNFMAVVIESIGIFGPYDNESNYPESRGCGELIFDPLRPLTSSVSYKSDP